MTEDIWKEFHERLRNFIKTKVYNETDVDEIMQESFYKIHKNIDKIKDIGKIESWLYQIVRNSIVDYFRIKKNIEFDENFHNDSFNIQSNNEELKSIVTQKCDNKGIKLVDSNSVNEIKKCIYPLMQNIPQKYIEAVKYVDYDGNSQIDLANELSISVSGAKSRVQRGRKMIKDELLGCCKFEFDNRGKVLDYYRKDNKESTTSCDLC